jgi:hypothetical protein
MSLPAATKADCAICGDNRLCCAVSAPRLRARFCWICQDCATEITSSFARECRADNAFAVAMRREVPK